MTITNEFKQYGDIVSEQGKLALAGVRASVLAAVGAGDLFATRVTEQSKALVARTQELAAVRVTPADVRDYLTSAGEQAVTTYAKLSERGAEVVHEFRKDPRVQRVILRAERTVDVVEDGLEDLLEEVTEDVEQAADTARTGVAEATGTAKSAVADGAERTRTTVRKAAARNTNARKSTATTPPARKAPARKAAARKTTARQAAAGKTGTAS